MAKEKSKKKDKMKGKAKGKTSSIGTLTKKELVKRVVHFFQINPTQLFNYRGWRNKLCTRPHAKYSKSVYKILSLNGW